MPQLLRRIVRFTEQYPTEQNAAELCQAMSASFLSGAGVIRAWAVVHEGQIVGHVLAQFDATRRTVFLHQLELDRSVPVAQRREGEVAVEAWARACGATRLEAVTWHEDRVFRRYGFQRERSIIRRKL